MVLGDGPAAGRLRDLAESLGVRGRVNWHGFIADRPAYMEALASTDIFVFPSPAEGFPKVVLDAWAVGLPVVASPAGALGAMRGRGLYREAEGSIAAAVSADPDAWLDLRRAGFAFASDHTRPAEAARLVARWRDDFPGLIPSSAEEGVPAPRPSREAQPMQAHHGRGGRGNRGS